MRNRRKRYYHKIIVMRRFSSGIFCYILLVFFALGTLVAVASKMNLSVGQTYVHSQLRHFFPVTYTKQRYFPTVYDCISSVIPSVQASEEMAKKYAARYRGVKRAQESAEEETKVQLNVKELDMSSGGITFRNETGYTPDVSALLNMKLDFSNEAKVLIIHTHTSEAYAESEGARSTDNEKNVVRVGAVLKNQLEKKEISVIHDTTRNDYPAYNGSYAKALSGISTAVANHPSIQVVLDVHRDYAEQKKDGVAVQLKPVTKILGEPVAQVMFVVGTDGLGLYHPDWKQNLAFAVQIQEELNRISPKLARPINIRRERFNQHMTRGSIIIEAGTAGNRLAECERLAEYLGDAIAQVMKQ